MHRLKITFSENTPLIQLPLIALQRKSVFFRWQFCTYLMQPQPKVWPSDFGVDPFGYASTAFDLGIVNLGKRDLYLKLLWGMGIVYHLKSFVSIVWKQNIHNLYKNTIIYVDNSWIFMFYIINYCLQHKFSHKSKPADLKSAGFVAFLSYLWHFQ